MFSPFGTFPIALENQIFKNCVFERGLREDLKICYLRHGNFVAGEFVCDRMVTGNTWPVLYPDVT